MASLPVPPAPVYGPDGQRIPYNIVKKSPVKELHSLWQSSGQKGRMAIAIPKYRFRIRTQLEAMLKHPCLDAWKPLSRKCSCSCMEESGLSYSSEELRKCIDDLISFACMEKREQQLLVIQWIRYSDVLLQNQGSKKIFLMPGCSICICKNALQRMLGMKAKSWKTCDYHAKKGTIPKHGLEGRVGDDSNRGKGSSQQRELLKNFFERMVSMASPRATLSVRVLTDNCTRTELRDDALIDLPPHFTRAGLYQQCVFECGFKLEYDDKHRLVKQIAIPGVEHKAYPAESTFRNYWNTNYPHLKIPNAREDICGDCHIFNNKNKYLSKLLKEEQDEDDDAEVQEAGSEEEEEPVVFCEYDKMPRDELKETRETLVLQAAKHVVMARKQRQVFIEKKEEAFNTRDLPRDQRKYCFVADYAQNCCIPSFSGDQPGETYYYSPLSAYVFGVADCSRKPTHMTAHVYLENESGKGGNNVASLLWKEFEQHGLLSPTLGPPAAEINLFFDNCGGQNKNRIVLRLLLYMVKRGLCKKATAYFLVRGHTKNDCDRLFNLMKKTCRKRNIYTPRDLYLALDDHEDIDASPMEEAPFYDWDTLEDKFMRRPPGVKAPHVFSVDDTDSDLLWIQDYVGGAPAISHNVVKKPFRDANATWYLEEPLELPMKGMQHIKWIELHDKWAPLVPIDKRLEWEYYHTDLAKEHRDSVKEHTKESKKQRKGRQRDSAPKKKKDEDDDEEIHGNKPNTNSAVV